MGKSVFMLPGNGAAFNRAQVRRLRDQLGAGALRLEGPFSDSGGAVAEIADHVRRRVRRSAGSNEMEAAMMTLMPQDLLPRGYPSSHLSQLDIPFVTIPSDDGFLEEHESAGALARSPTVSHEGRESRRTSPAELTVLGISVLRSLGVECHYMVPHFDVSALNSIMSVIGTEFTVSSPPLIGVVMGERLAITAVFPMRGVGGLPFDMLPLSCLEILDSDAVLSFLKMRNSWKYARSLMEDVRSRGPDFDGEGELRSMQVGHTLHEAGALWALEAAQSDVEAARQMFGKAADGIASIRETDGELIVHTLTCPYHHMKAAAKEILCESAREKVVSLPESHDVSQIIETMEAVVEHPCIVSLMAYLGFALNMKRHFHPVPECGELNRGGGN